MNNKNINSMEALKLLLEGNRRFINGVRSVENIATSSKLQELADKGQSPFAIVLTCSDSRVPTEIIFDRGFGDLFVIRIAGNIVAPSIIGSIEFAASNFGTPLCIVMGHSQCGAVKAAINSEIANEEDCPSNVGRIVKKVRPAVRTVAKNLGQPLKSLEFEKLLHLSTIENIRSSANIITKRSPTLQDLIVEKKLSVICALYDLHTGQVDFDLPEDFASQFQEGRREINPLLSFKEPKSLDSVPIKRKASS